MNTSVTENMSSASSNLSFLESLKNNVSKIKISEQGGGAFKDVMSAGRCMGFALIALITCLGFTIVAEKIVDAIR